jgi:hypothetical protein
MLINLNLRFDLPEEQPIVVYDRNEDEELIDNLQPAIAFLIMRMLQQREQNEISSDTE